MYIGDEVGTSFGAIFLHYFSFIKVL